MSLGASDSRLIWCMMVSLNTRKVRDITELLFCYFYSLLGFENYGFCALMPFQHTHFTNSFIVDNRNFQNLPPMRQTNSLNLSILLSVGKDTNKHFFSSGERTRNSPIL